MDRAGEIFAYDPNNPPTELVQCSLCRATFPVAAVKDGTLDLDAKKCPKCPKK